MFPDKARPRACQMTMPSDDNFVARALLKWPEVPASYGWLGLSGRGRWLIQGASISHPGILNFLGRHYQADQRGCWYVQNGPQRAYVDLELAPWILFLDGHNKLVTHTGRQVTKIAALVITDTGQIYMLTEHGFGALSDRDLANFLSCCRAVRRSLSDDQLLESLLELNRDRDARLELEWDGRRIRCRHVPWPGLEREFGFVRHPTGDR